MLLTIYRLLSYPIYPAVWVWLRLRERNGKEDGLRLRERFGKTPLARPNGKLIWFHAASVGEANSLVPLLNALHTAYPHLNLLITTGTVTSARIIKDRLPEKAFHQFVPVDLLPCVRRFLAHWKPDAAIWVESEFWPNLLLQTHRRHIPMALINARMSDRSHAKWSRFRRSFLQLAGCFDICYAGSKDDWRKFKNLGIDSIREIGNLKYDAPPLPVDPKATAKLLSNMGDRRVWLAASTHPGEEQIMADVHRQLKETFPDILTLIVPRHASRGEEIISLLTRQKFTVSCRSRQQPILAETDLYIADTMGELGLLYRLSGIVFIGGSLIPHGGHNPIEAAQLDCAVICGPHMHNFRGICRELLDEGALIQIKSSAELATTVLQLLRDHEEQEKRARLALQATRHRGGVADILVRELASMIGEKPESIPQGESA